MQTYAMAMPRGKFILQIGPATTSPCCRAPARTQRCLFWHQDCTFGPDLSFEVSLGALGHAYSFFDLSRRAGAGGFRDPGARRNGGALRHLDGGHSADDRP